MSITTNKTDITIRAQLATCCAGKKAAKLTKQLKQGGNCIESDFREFSLLSKYIEILECYATEVKTLTEAVPAMYVYDASSWTAGTDFNLILSLGGFYIGNNTNFTVTGQTSNAGALQAIVDLINAETGETLAFYDDSNKHFVLIYPTAGTVGNSKLTYWSTSGSSYPSISNIYAVFSGGTAAITRDDTDLNCVTEDQLQSIFENISKLCNICFKPLGFTYGESLDNGVDTRITEAGENRITESGDKRITE